MTTQFTKAVKLIECFADKKNVLTLDLPSLNAIDEARLAASEAMDTQARLTAAIDRLTRDLNQAKACIDDGEGRLNSAGIVQGKGNEIDMLVAELAARAEGVIRLSWMLKRVLPFEMVTRAVTDSLMVANGEAL